MEVNGGFDEDPDDSLKFIIYNKCDIKEAQKAKLLDATYFKVDEKSAEE